jgi:hypothetical protein
LSGSLEEKTQWTRSDFEDRVSILTLEAASLGAAITSSSFPEKNVSHEVKRRYIE